MNAVLEWKEKRNRLIHALLKQELHTEDLLELAEDGRKLTRQMCSKATSHRRVLERIKNQAQVPEQVKHDQ